MMAKKTHRIDRRRSAAALEGLGLDSGSAGLMFDLALIKMVEKCNTVTLWVAS